MKRVSLFAMILIVTASATLFAWQAPQSEQPVDPVESCKRLAGETSAAAFRIACERALSNTRLLNYLCEQQTKRTDSDFNRSNIVAQVRFVDGNVSYSDVTVNGHPAANSIDAASGAVGEFGAVLQQIFHPQNQVEFKFRMQTKFNGRPALLYDFRVGREGNKTVWYVRLPQALIYPGYTGRLWLNKTTSQPIRLELTASELPPGYAFLNIALKLDYGEVTLNDGTKYVLPVKAESFVCNKNASICDRNRTGFSKFRRFKAEHVITLPQ